MSKLKQVDGSFELWMETDDGTSEHLKLSMPSWSDLLEQFRLWGDVFHASDWEKLVDPEAHLWPGVRAVIWLCDEEDHQPMINWQPSS
ncbi:hypothetical protein [Microbulbifer variabilis]|uniref:hypothetical protein n=1 Tax=Microbulbifer variabilis TaxID=266805 RepID=UPI001CFD6D88|nr:hypothetical protein [Microbulbifer variabilis]